MMDDAARRALGVTSGCTHIFSVAAGSNDIATVACLQCIATALRELEVERDELRTKAEKIIDERDSQIGRVMQERDALATRLERVEGALRDLIGASPPVCQCQACINAHAALMPDTPPRFEDPVDGTDRDLKWIRDNP